MRERSGRNTPNEVLVHKGKRTVSHKKKADCFGEHYVEVSQNNFTQEDGKTNRKTASGVMCSQIDGKANVERWSVSTTS